MSLSSSYFYYHPFVVGEIGIRFSKQGLLELDISQIFRDLSTEINREASAKRRWSEVSNAISDLNYIEDQDLQRVITNTIHELTEYFSGSRRIFTLPIAFEGCTAFQKMVWQSLQTIPYGVVISYKILAEKISNPKAVRAVGSANGKNPLPIIIPCHRVIQANGTLGGYSGGLHVKQALLTLEGVSFSSGKVLI